MRPAEELIETDCSKYENLSQDGSEENKTKKKTEFDEEFD
jgi:hypothetical protein